MRHYRQKGFGFIELLVTIAVIGILAGIIFASTLVAKTKARDERIKSDVIQLRLKIESDFSATTNYNVSFSSASSLVSSGDYQTLQTDIVNVGGTGALTVVANPWPDPTAYALYGRLTTNNLYFCVDSKGLVREDVADNTQISCP